MRGSKWRERAVLRVRVCDRGAIQHNPAGTSSSSVALRAGDSLRLERAQVGLQLKQPRNEAIEPNLCPQSSWKRKLCLDQVLFTMSQCFFQRPYTLVISRYGILPKHELIDADGLGGDVSARVQDSAVLSHGPTVAGCLNCAGFVGS